MLIILFIPRKAFIPASLVTKLRPFMIDTNLFELQFFESVTFSKTSSDLGSQEKCSNMLAINSYCTLSLDLSVLFHLQVVDFF